MKSNPQDTATAVNSGDSIDLAAQYYEPQFAAGFPTKAAGDSVEPAHMRLDSLAVMERPVAGDAHEIVSSPLHDAGAMALFLLAGFLLVTSYRSGYKYIENLANYLFSVKRRDSIFDDHTVSETRIMVTMLFNTWVMEGLLMYYAVAYTQPTLVLSLQQSVFTHVALFTGIAAAFHLVQSLLYRLLGWTFDDALNTRLWTSGFNATQATLGVLLLPLAIIALVYPAAVHSVLIWALSLYILGRLVFIFKGFRIFFNNLSSSLYFILYLCSVEVVPPLSIYAGTIFLCNVIA